MKRRDALQDERGFIVVLLAIVVLFIFCALAGLAIDVSRTYLVRGELQKAADAAALAGAGNLYPSSITPSWTVAETAANIFVGQNSADGSPLNQSNITQIVSGYCDPLSSSSGLSQGIRPGVCIENRSQQCTADAECTNGCFYVNPPAVQVTLTKPVQTFFANMLGRDQFQPSATAVAVAAKSGPSLPMPAGTIFPFAITQAVVDNFLNGLNPFSSIDPSGTPVGQWVGLTNVPNSTSANTLQGYIDQATNGSTGGAAPSIQAGDSVNVATGDMSTLYRATDSLIAAGRGLVFLPIVASITPGSAMTVRGFARVQLVSASNSPSIITGRLVIAKLVR
jgi:hypothetical protein